jgi:Flp pilus assembly protein TadG
MKFWAWCRRLAGEDGGSEIAEAAMVMPLVFMFLLGIIWFGRAFNIYSTITYAAREGAQVAVQGAAASCAMCTPTPPTAAQVATRVGEVLRASHIDPGQVSSYTPTPAPTNGTCPGSMTTNTSGGVTVFGNAQLNISTTTPGLPPACGVIVSFKYPFQFYFPFTSLNKQQVLLKAAVQMQGEN